MKILVTGAAGFVGKHLVKELKENGHVPIAVVNVTDPDVKGIKSIHADLSIAEAVYAKVDFKEIDGVIHLAGLAAVGPSFDEPMRYISTNIGIEVNLFETAIRQKCTPRFLIISSGALYNPKAPLPLSENSKVVPSSPYAVSKIGQEQMAHYYGMRGFEYIIARPFNHVGPGQNEGFIVPDLSKQIIAVERGETNEIRVGNLEAKRDYTDVRDIVRAYRLLIEKGKNGEIYNICSGKSLSGNEILKQLLLTSKVKPKIVEDPAKMRPSDTPDIYGDNTKITTDTGWQPVIKINQTIKDALEDWRNRL